MPVVRTTILTAKFCYRHERDREETMPTKKPSNVVTALRRATALTSSDEEFTIRTATLSPENAQEILDQMMFERQRNIVPGHVGMLADMMAGSQFRAGSQITFAPNDNGDLVLVDGQHRLQAAITANWTTQWSIRTLWKDRAEDAYIVMDTSVRQRSSAVIGKAVGYDNLSNRAQNAIIAAARYQNTWRSDYQLPALCNTPPVLDNVARANERIGAFAAADPIINEKHATTQIKRRLSTPMIMAIMTETLHALPEEAVSFWTEVANNGRGVAGELKDALIEGRPTKAAVNFIPRLAAHAWNQRHSNGRLRREHRRPLRVEDTTLVIPA